MRRGGIIAWVLCMLLVGPPLLGHSQEESRGGKETAASKSALRITVASNRNERFELIRVDLQGEQAEVVVDDPRGVMEPAWSADGNHLAFVSFRTGVGQIFAKKIGDGTAANLTGTEQYERQPAWSPDGKRILFTSNRSGDQDIWAMDATGENVMNLTGHAGYDADPAFSPDGKQIAFASMRDAQPFRLFVMDAKGFAQRPLSDAPLVGWVYPDWSPDGTKIVVGQYANGSVQLQIVDVASGGLTALTDTPGVNSFARWSPDGRFIAYAHFDGPPRPFNHGVTELDLTAAGGDLMVYEVESGKHSVVLRGELPLWGPRPSWQTVGAER